MRHLALVTAVAVFLMAGCARLGIMRSEKVAEATAAADDGLYGCQLETFTVPSAAMQREIRTAVLLPPAYAGEPGRRFPVLFAMHGVRAPYNTWTEMGPLRQALREMPMIVCTFDAGERARYGDSPSDPQVQFSTFFFNELVPFIEAHYRTNGVYGATGFSAGGSGAFHYMLTKPEMFASISALSSGMMGGGGGFQTRMADAIAREVLLPPVMIYCGTEDGALEGCRNLEQFLIEQNVQIRTRLEARVADETDEAKRTRALDNLMLKEGLRFTYMESSGAHNWPFWQNASRAVAEFHWRSFEQAAQ